MDTSSGRQIDVPIDKAAFWDNEQFTQYLYSNRPFPIVWSSGGTVQKITEFEGGNRETALQGPV